METIGEVTVDGSGNVAIPNEICERLGFTPGERLLVEKGNNGELRLTPSEVAWQAKPREPSALIDESLALTEDQVRIIEKDGLLVITGIPPELLENIVEREREARMDDLLKGSGL